MRLTLLLLTILMVAGCSEDPVSPPDDGGPLSLAEEFEDLVPALMAENGVPGAAVALIQGGEVVLRKGFGVASIAASRSVTPNTTFRVGELSTMFAGWSAQSLGFEGKISLETAVEPMLGGWRFPDSGFDHRAISINLLLKHRGGTLLRQYPGFGPNVSLPTVKESLSGDTNGAGDVRVEYEPDTQTQYSAGGITVVQLAIDTYMGGFFSSFERHVREDFMQRIGMSTSSFIITPQIQENLATPYDETGNSTELRRFTAQAATGLVTSLDDLVAYAAAISSAYNGTSFQIPGFSRAPITTLLDAARPDQLSYLMGHEVRQLGSVRTIGQTSSIHGWTGHMQIDPAAKSAIIVLTNSSNGSPLGRELICRWLEDLSGQRSDEFCSAL